ncbi:MAG: DNA primase [Chloroflexi bacterium]|nr:DNA primase [Chloroflexota bacterium]
MAASSEIERVRERVDIVDLINRHVPLKKAGRTYKACCPFHQEKTPSFVVYPETQSFHCFGCGQNGDAFSFLMKMEGLDFPGALGRLAEQTGVELSRRTGGEPAIDAHRQQLLDATAIAAAFFQHLLLHASAGAPGRDSLERRGIARTSVEMFGLGYAPDSWDTLRTHLREREIPEATATEAGLLSEQAERGRIYDRFRGRLIFPIRDREGRIRGFGGRIVGDGQPKYLNSAQSAIFDKSHLLYGLDLAAADIKRADQVVIVEGYVDALMAHQCGHANVVATMGTALTEAQVGSLKPLTRRLVLALDADAAGQLATLRGIATLRQALADDVAPVIDGRGLIDFQRRLNADIRIMPLPAGEDPDSLLRRDAAAWPGLVDGARPLIDFMIEALLAGADLGQPAAKRQIVDQVVPVLREIGDPVIVAHYANQLGRRLGLDDRVIVNEVAKRALRVARQSVREEAATARQAAPVEDYLLGLLLRYPEVALGLADRVEDTDFTDVRNRLVWTALRERLVTGGAAATTALATSLDDALAGRVTELVERLRHQAELPPARAREEAVETLKNVRRRHDERAREYWQTLLRDVETGGDGPPRDEILGHLAELVGADRHHRYYPRPSPYFRDIRTRDS